MKSKIMRCPYIKETTVKHHPSENLTITTESFGICEKDACVLWQSFDENTGCCTANTDRRIK